MCTSYCSASLESAAYTPCVVRFHYCQCIHHALVYLTATTDVHSMLCSTSLPSPVCIPCSVHLPGHHVPLYLCKQHCIFHALLYIPAGTSTPSPWYDLYGWLGMDSKWPVCQYTSWFVIHLLVHSMICCTSASTLHGLLFICNCQYTSWSAIHLSVHFMICYSSATASTLHDLFHICQYISLPAVHLPVHFMVYYTAVHLPVVFMIC